ncbi:phosphate ABC transporter substrate-binding protein PstS [Pseudoxanthomonas winnipegensis]|uniref:Phosphate-binding protein PstS n=1 Tax=Pseudoxanthomonas winnipegensis TaxID=2480810 RepID=A0A4V2HF68_9GAMM|nr:phosphate ABC transporter substrate-binding protein PstS [Pseudoxanthomonas winnipegensis]TAA36095.1 phosphate ABC transporter substrate-binding protein PstS [Pseudoxanthomonas winnipegensis]
MPPVHHPSGASFVTHLSKIRVLAGAVVATLALSANPASAADITGAGASFIYPVVTKWSADYATATGNKVNYQSIGSGGGIAQIKANTVDFGSSDKPLDSAELSASGLVQFPSVIGGVVPVFNVAGVAPGALKLDGATLANIFLGKIAKWNDPAIAALNPGLALPDQKITIVHRSDGSGTSFNFTNYLSKVSPEWKSKIGEGTTVQWPAGIGGKGNEGVAAYVKQIKGGVGYVEYAYALQNKLAYASMRNSAGKFVLPSDETFSAAASSADWAKSKDFNLVITNAPGADAWPITATNFILMRKSPKSTASAKGAKDFFKWVYASGDAQAKALDYVPLPDPLVQQIQTYWSTNLKY